MLATERRLRLVCPLLLGHHCAFLVFFFSFFFAAPGRS